MTLKQKEILNRAVEVKKCLKIICKLVHI
uniref:Uncharacterized protein n=1 Tax=Anguilla anguilla TaxID=7936 RepID=A0A0E9R3W6_ANGAN